MPDERHPPAPSSSPPALEAEIGLLRRIQAGDENALERLLHLHWSSLLRFSRRIVKDPARAEDAVREAFIKLWNRPRRWSEGAGLRPTLFRLVRANAFRKAQVGPRPEANGPELSHNSRDRQEKTEADLVRQAVDVLPERRREIFLLVRLHQLSYQEVAYVLGLSADQVEEEVRRAMRQITDALLPSAPNGANSSRTQAAEPREVRRRGRIPPHRPTQADFERP